MDLTLQKHLCRECGRVLYIDRKDMCHGERVMCCPLCSGHNVDLIGYVTHENLKEIPVEDEHESGASEDCSEQT